jgi:hypothetical protein
MNRKALIVIILSIPVFALDSAIVASGKIPLIAAGIPFIGTFVVFWVIFLVLRRRDGQKVQADERNVKIEGRAYTYSWWISFYVIILLMGVDTLGLFKLFAAQCYTYILFAMLASYWILRSILNRKADVE